MLFRSLNLAPLSRSEKRGKVKLKDGQILNVESMRLPTENATVTVSIRPERLTFVRQT